MLAAVVAVPTPEPMATLSPGQLLARIRQQFRSHRPPPAYETYTLERVQQHNDGSTDDANSYVFRVWVRNSDRGALKREILSNGSEDVPVFDRPAFNSDGDPGPPTADVFEPRPATPHPISQAYTPEPANTPMAVIGRVQSLMERDYRVTRVAYEGEFVHLSLTALTDPARNRLREIYADKNTFELTKLVANDRLFVTGAYSDEFSDQFTMTMGTVNGIPVVTRIHSVAGTDKNGLAYLEDGRVIDFTFSDIAFPATLPDWYFDPQQYGGHPNEIPE